MRKIFYLFFCFLAISSFISCSDDNSNTSASPKLVFSSDSIIFLDSETQNLLISLDGANECSYEVLSHPDWVDVSPSSGYLLKKIQTIEVTPKSFSTDTVGVYTDDLIIYSSFGTTKTISLKRFVGECLLYNFQKNISITETESSGNLSIYNAGNVNFSYKITASNNYLSLSSKEGSVNVGNTENIRLDVNKDSLGTGIYNTELYIDINNKRDTVNVIISNLNEKKIILKSEIVDAEFSKVTNKIIYVSSDPLSLVIYDVEKKMSESITLKYMPTSLSISNDGKTAVVAHDAHISYIDLINKKVVSIVDVPFEVKNIVLGNNKWAYLIGNDNRNYLHSINMDEKILHYAYNYSSVYDNSKIKLHPSGNYICVYNSSSSYSFTNFQIESGIANSSFQYYDNSGNSGNSNGFNFSEDGKRIFVNNGIVLKCTDVYSQSFIYNGKIKNIDTIVGLANSSNSNNLYILNKPSDYYNSENNDFVSVYNSENLLFKKKIELERYIVRNSESATSYKSVPHFIFTNTAGNKVYVLADAPESGLLYSWSLQELDIE